MKPRVTTMYPYPVDTKDGIPLTKELIRSDGKGRQKMWRRCCRIRFIAYKRTLVRQRGTKMFRRQKTWGRKSYAEPKN